MSQQKNHASQGTLDILTEAANNVKCLKDKDKSKSKKSSKKDVTPNKIKTLSFFSSKIIKENFAKAAAQRPVVTVKAETVRHRPKISESPINTLSLYDRWALSNPIPGWVDPITGEEMKVPAVSPDYSLLDYSTWLHTIKSSPEDPFTKKPITKRQITVLSLENWDEYKDKIMEKYYDLCAPTGHSEESP